MKFDFDDMCSNFYRHKELIINLFIQYYGEEYSELIKNRVENTYYNFSSPPDYDYFYMLKNIKNIRKKDIALITLKNQKYKLICSYIDKQIKKELLTFVTKKTGSTTIRANDISELLCIDGIDIKELLYNSSLTQNEINDNDRQKLENILKRYGIEKVESITIDEILLFKNTLIKKRFNYIASHSDFGLQIFLDFKKNYKINLPQDALSLISFDSMPFSGSIEIQKDNKEGIVFCGFIRVPLTFLYSQGVNWYDVAVIHELIHRVERNDVDDRTGIMFDKVSSGDSAFNEIRVQKLAIKITEQLHAMNIFLYDTPNDFKLCGGSLYEEFFPLIGKFMEKYELILSDCAINNDFDGLIDVFGPSFINFYNKLNDMFYDLVQNYLNTNKLNVLNDAQIDILITEMDKYFKNKYVKVKKYKNNILNLNV